MNLSASIKKEITYLYTTYIYYTDYNIYTTHLRKG